MFKKLYEFGYGDKGCRVCNYWEEGHPARVDGVNAKTLVLSRGSRCVVIVTNYGDGVQCVLTLDNDVLRLPTNAQAKDMETGELVESVKTALLPSRLCYTFALKKHDFKALLIE